MIKTRSSADTISDVEQLPPQNTPQRIPLPAMSEDSIEAYFYSLEFWFEASRVFSDTAKFNIVLASVPPAKLLEMRHLIDDTPPTDKFSYIRRRIIENFAESQQSRLQRVLKELPLGDRRPSDLYHEMRRTAGTTLSESILHDLWVSRLPTCAQAAIIATSVPISDKIKIADSLTECLSLKDGGQIFEIRTESQPQGELSDIRNEIAALSKPVGQLMRNVKSTGRQRSRSTSRERPVIQHTNNFCWYHANATKCRQPCSFPPVSS
ncbi:PREDICTED: uncharacterized protein LOC108968146 [Bactrocera latifrons]|uniref:uncharacterized protein LOC108968146 n=1 Tax=Bactrocera latifrons TaxID=174628 RepID=UPI0008DC7B21|nr:PREDICTED: uncharacterized protein LOC108968146 [Bactrocera latifrons]